MKKLAIIAAGAALLALVAAPAMALDISFRGSSYRITYYTDSNFELNDDDASSVYGDSRLRIRTRYTVNKNLRVTTQFDVHDSKPWGRGNEVQDNNSGFVSTSRFKHNIEWDRAWADVKTGWGDIQFGAVGSGSWGHRFLNHSIDTSRIRVRTKAGPLTLVGLYEKYAEGDEGVDISDGDVDAWSLGATFSSGAMELGALYTYQMDKAGTSDGCGTSNYLNGTRCYLWNLTGRPSVFVDEMTLHEVKPYFVGKFGGFTLSAKGLFQFGQIDFDTPGAPDVDLSGMAYNVEGSLKLGPVTLEAGYAFRSGDDKSTTDEIEKYMLGGQNINTKQTWNKLYMLIDDDQGYGNSNRAGGLGGTGNFARNYGDPRARSFGSGQYGLSGGTNDGYQVFYGSAFIQPTKSMDVGFRVGYMIADEVLKGQDDKVGVETDVYLTMQFYKNLEWQFIFAWLNAGDYWKGPNPTASTPDPEDNFATFNRLTLKF